jgi:hypothetical protein
VGFLPMNRHLLVRPSGAFGDEEVTGIVLPQDYLDAQEHVKVEVLSVAGDCTAFSEAPACGCMIVVPKNMILEINTGSATYSLVQENYILGVVTP